MHLTHRRRLTGALTATLCALAGVAATQAPSEARGHGNDHGRHHGHHHGRTMDVQLLSFNDFHGNLTPPDGSSGRLVLDHRLDTSVTPAKAVDVTTDTLSPAGVGGVEYLATHLADARKGHPNSLTVAAGDIVGASPLLSAAFHDEPTVEAMNNLGLDVTAVGNHEFDEGYREIQRLQYGGCLDDGDGANNQNSCPDGSFGGADYSILAANVKYHGTDRTILPAYKIENVNGARIGFIGMTLKDTPSIVTAAGVEGLDFSDEVETANALVPVLRAKGVKAIVVLIHQGGSPTRESWTGPNGQTYSVNPRYDWACAKGGSLASDSAILPIAAGLDPQIDLIISGHTHQPYVCDVKDPAGQSRLVTSASSFGRLYTDTELKYDRRTQDIVRASVQSSNVLVTRNVAKDPAETSLIGHYKELIAPIASRVIGHITSDVTNSSGATGESQLGDLIADAQLADPSVVTGGQTPVIAFMNPGGIRNPLTWSASLWGEADGDITFEEAFNVQPFNNYLVSLTLTGQDIYDLLAQQVTGSNSGTNRKILQVSNGFTYQLGATGAVDGTVKLNNVPIDKNASYRVVTNNFLQGGGDNFAAFKNGTDVYYGGLDIDAFANYLEAHSPYTPGALTRITQ